MGVLQGDFQETLVAKLRSKASLTPGLRGSGTVAPWTLLVVHGRQARGCWLCRAVWGVCQQLVSLTAAAILAALMISPTLNLVDRVERFAGMGNLLKVLTREIENYPHFFLDFENAQPTEGEREIWNQISAVLQDSESILADLQAYKGAGPEIRDAIQNPNDIQLQEKAWNAVCPLVVRLKRFYEFSIRLEKALQSLLESLTCPPYTPTQHLEREQALAKEFAEILHFTLRFDELKMRNPAIQNDFSYYRRTISRNRINNMHLDIENEVNNEMANRMSLFYAEATPMLKTLSNATMHFVSENKTLPIENTTDCLSTMTSVCKVMLETPEYRSRFTSEETLMFCMRVMVGVIILYDHVHPMGAFCKTSKIDMKGCIKVLKEQAPDSVEGLLNALR
ncbi:hypothetical protein HPG69_008390 [Diceros bicornis minor]|uniref:CYRIA/CYRIB Rac1 binding domain-containing protein n=2 Tax=Perissodactyla TaxID=9787 RepID=A0A7J7ENK5_DICBM|nr:hypothetical protein HPG69_008390 [Diceros bicornis minor]